MRRNEWQTDLTPELLDKHVRGALTVRLDFDSPADFANAAKETVSERLQRRYDDASWTGQTRDEALHSAIHGNDKLVPEAQKMLEQIQSVGIEIDRPAYMPSVCGAYPIVADFLSGAPNSMRRRMNEQSDRAPVRIYVSLSTSAGIKAEAIAKRGTAILAFVMALSAMRPVELFAVTSLDAVQYNSGIVSCVVRIPANPLELSTACHALTAASFPRSLGYSLCHQHDGSNGDTSTGGWPWGVRPTSEQGRAVHEAAFRHCYGLEPQDIYVPPVFLNDALVNEPVKWINDALAKYRSNPEE